MRIAIVQDGPEYLDLTGTVAKTVAYIKEAAREKADLVVFGECWVSGYPAWLDVCADVGLWDYEPVKEVWARTFESAIQVDSPELKTIQQVSASEGIAVIIGANEAIPYGPGNDTIYNSVFTLAADGRLVNHHRKLIPTYTERLVHGQGDGAGLKSVSMPFGRVGSLICWEHWMPLARQAMHESGEDLHIALWPMVKEMNHVACRHYAFEGRCTVAAVGQIMHKDEIPATLDISDKITIPDDGLILRGGSAVYNSDGSFNLPQVYDQRKMIIADLNLLSDRPRAMNLSVAGHYHRPDVFQLEINRKRIFPVSKVQ